MKSPLAELTTIISDGKTDDDTAFYLALGFELGVAVGMLNDHILNVIEKGTEDDLYKMFIDYMEPFIGKKMLKQSSNPKHILTKEVCEKFWRAMAKGLFAKKN